MRTRTLLLLALALLSAGCASGGTGGDTDRPTGARSRASSSTITNAELLDTHLQDAYAIVQRLRPNWLRRRGVDVPRAAQDVMVYVDTTPRGYAPALRNIRAAGIYEIRYLDPLAAKARYGPGHDHGVIIVVTSRG